MCCHAIRMHACQSECTKSIMSLCLSICRYLGIDCLQVKSFDFETFKMLSDLTKTIQEWFRLPAGLQFYLKLSF